MKAIAPLIALLFAIPLAAQEHSVPYVITVDDELIAALKNGETLSSQIPLTARGKITEIKIVYAAESPGGQTNQPTQPNNNRFNPSDNLQPRNDSTPNNGSLRDNNSTGWNADNSEGNTNRTDSNLLPIIPPNRNNSNIDPNRTADRNLENSRFQPGNQSTNTQTNNWDTGQPNGSTRNTINDTNTSRPWERNNYQENNTLPGKNDTNLPNLLNPRTNTRQPSSSPPIDAETRNWDQNRQQHMQAQNQPNTWQNNNHLNTVQDPNASEQPFANRNQQNNLNGGFDPRLQTAARNNYSAPRQVPTAGHNYPPVPNDISYPNMGNRDSTAIANNTVANNRVPAAALPSTDDRGEGNLVAQSDSSRPFGVLYFLLLCSIGLNFYLGWISRSFYVRYSELAEELRETFSSAV